MIADFEDFCLYLYVVIDDLWAQIGHHYRRPGPAPACSDSELLTLVLAGECRGWDQETDLVAAWQAYRALFPVLPERSRFNRRRRNLMYAINDLRRVALTLLDLAQDRQCAIDSLPVPVMHFHLVPGSPSVGTWKAAGAAFGKVPTKKQTIFGYKLHLLVPSGGVILDFALAPANAHDLTVGADLLATHRELVALGDKAYRSAAAAAALQAEAAVTLSTQPRSAERTQRTPALLPQLAHGREIVETVSG